MTELAAFRIAAWEKDDWVGEIHLSLAIREERFIRASARMKSRIGMRLLRMSRASVSVLGKALVIMRAAMR